MIKSLISKLMISKSNTSYLSMFYSFFPVILYAVFGMFTYASTAAK